VKKKYTVRFLYIISSILYLSFTQCEQNKRFQSLIPNIQNPSPDYYCTWQVQHFYTNAIGTNEMRANITESNMFDGGKFQNWVDFYPEARQDLIFVMDDSWDIPFKYTNEYGSLILSSDKFPSFANDSISNKDALKALTTAVKSKGWKGLGGWVWAGESEMFINNMSPEDYWIERAKWANYSGFSYWKVDWGKKIYDYDFRKQITDISHKYAPGLNVENAQIDGVIPVSDVFRTYDVPAIMSIPMTMDKLKHTLGKYTAKDGYNGLINCEDEVYTAAALGCTMGVMRHPFTGNMPNGKPDMSWPSMHRNIKSKIDEITRAVRWHRIAPAFSVNASETIIDSTMLTDTWVLQDSPSEIEDWWFKPWTGLHIHGDTISESGPARIARRLPLPKVVPDENGDLPYVVASKNPNGAVSIATLGRTHNRKYWIPKCDITIYVTDAGTYGIFGRYNRLTLQTNLNLKEATILAQDLAGKVVVDITSKVIVEGGSLIVPGSLIDQIGTSEQNPNDTSEPGLVLVIMGSE